MARAKIIHRLSHMMPLQRLNMIAEGIFFSILNYCIEVYGNVWSLSTYDEQSRTNSAFTREDNMKLQVLVNKALRSLTGLGHDTPVSVLSEVSGRLSVHQRTALYTLTSVHKAMLTMKPVYSYEHLVPNHDPPQQNLRRPSNYTID